MGPSHTASCSGDRGTSPGAWPPPCARTWRGGVADAGCCSSTSGSACSGAAGATSAARPLPPLYFGMDDSLYFSEQHLQVRDMVRDFARNVVKPSARAYDLESKFPW